jgi:hypothetical protein
MNAKTKKALLIGGPIVFVIAKRLPPGQALRLPLLLVGGAGALVGAWETYLKESRS